MSKANNEVQIVQVLRSVERAFTAAGVPWDTERLSGLRASLDTLQANAATANTRRMNAIADIQTAQTVLVDADNLDEAQKTAAETRLHQAEQVVGDADDVLEKLLAHAKRIEADSVADAIAMREYLDRAAQEEQKQRDVEEREAAEKAEQDMRRAQRSRTTLAAEVRAALGNAADGLSEELIAVLEENLNGSPLASDAEVAAGYISSEHYFHYFRDTVAEIPAAAGPRGTRTSAAEAGEKLPASFLRNLALNCHWVRKGRNMTPGQFLMCYIKTLIAYSGVFTADTNERCVFIDEYQVHDVVPDGYVLTVRQMATIKAKPEVKDIEVEIRRNIHRIIGTAVHVFRTRNHHWTDSAQDFVARTWSAAWNGEAPQWDLPEEALFRLTLHCFGMKQLVDYCSRAEAKNLMPVALTIRKTAARAGTAPVRLVDAALKCMRSEPFYPEIRAAFGDDIDAIDAHVEELKAAGDQAHVNHWFMCGARQRSSYREAIAEPLMPVAVAYIQSLGARATLKTQVALNKRVANHSALVDTLKAKFEAYRKDIFDRTSLVELLRRYRAAAVDEAVRELDQGASESKTSSA